MVDPQNHKLSLSDQCRLFSIHRSGLYYKSRGESELNMCLMKIIDREIFDKPFYGVRRMTHHLKHMGYRINRKRIGRLYRLMDIRVIYPKKNLSKPGKGNKLYPYLLKGLTIDRPNQVWATDITWIPMKKGFMYLIAIIDLQSRFVVNWSISNSMDAAWCSEVLTEAIDRHGAPEILNTDQGSQFSSLLFSDVLRDNNVRISMDGKGRAMDNIFIERFWRSVKYEYAYLNPANGGLSLYQGMKKYMDFYNNQRPHQSLKYQVPRTVFEQQLKAA